MAIEQVIPAPVDLGDPGLYINRELSWLRFNERVLDQALDPSHPLLERVKFLSIFFSNLDEFFMIRVSGLRDQLAAGALEAPPDGMTPAEQLAEIRRRLAPTLNQAAAAWEGLMEELDDEGIHILRYGDLKKRQRKLLADYFESEVFPALTPLAFDPGHPFPHISNLSINLAVVVHDPLVGERFARVKVPAALPRFLRVPGEERAEMFQSLGLAEVAAPNFVWIEEVVAANLHLLFPGMAVVAAYPFRVTRDADVEIEEDEAADLLAAIEQGVGLRQFGSAVRLEVDEQTPAEIQDILINNLGLAPYQVYTVKGWHMGLSSAMEITSADRPDLKDPPFKPAVPPVFETDESIYSRMRRHDMLLYHPYDSFGPVVDFVQRSAMDKRVVTIKQTLYRVGPNSPVVQALLTARENGKQVAVLVELKARFDEENNIEWARALEQAGVHVVYGLVGLKTHCKMTLVVRQEKDGIRRYVHLGTGNYNADTARIYTDLGFFTTDPDIAADVADVFNSLTGYSRKEKYRKLLVAPTSMRGEVLRRIERETERHRSHGDGYLAFKLNALVDREVIEALYRASQAGVRIDLQVRGMCCLRPGMPGVSENITVTSIVGRFLEHARIYYFRNGGDEELYLGSADLMPRNLNRRVEVLFPVEDPALRENVMSEIMNIHLKDTVRARRLAPDGTYVPVEPAAAPLDSQAWLLDQRRQWGAEAAH